MERRFLGPVKLAPVEHTLPHDAHAGSLGSRLQDAVVLAGLTTFAKLEVLAEGPLREYPLLELHPLVEPIVVAWVVGVGQIHPAGGNVAVERHGHEKEDVAHAMPRSACSRSSSPRFSRSSRHPARARPGCRCP